MTQSNNLLITLSKWASGQHENFLSDAFVHLLNVLAQEEPDAFSMLIEKITAGAIRPEPESASDFHLVTQVTTEVGTPDIEISGPGSYGLIEVKDDSPVVVEQLERYASLIEQSDANFKCLVLLTRHYFPNPGIPSLVRAVRWTQVSEWLTNAKMKCVYSPASHHTIEQFL